MQQASFTVQVNTDDMGPIKQQVGVPCGKGSWHTAEVDAYFGETYVAAVDIKRLLTERPEGKGLVVPSKPAGPPGLELHDDRVQPYVVAFVTHDGTTCVFTTPFDTQLNVHCRLPREEA